MDEAWGLSAAHWAAVAALGTVATASIALVTAWLVLRQLDAARAQITEARRAQAEQERPYVIVSIDSSGADPQLMDLVVRNVGKTPARDVRLQLDPVPVRAEETPGMKLSEARLFNEALPLLPPNRTIRTFFDSAIDRKDTDLPTAYQARVTYENSAGTQWDEECVLDLDTLRGAMFVTTYGVHHVAKAVRELSKTFGKSSILGQRGRVETDTAVEARADRTERVEAEQRRRQQADEELGARLFPHDRDKPKKGTPDTESE